MKVFSAILAGAVIAASPLHAVTLGGWDFDPLSGYGPSPYSATTSASGVTVGALTRGSGVATSPAVGTINTWGGAGWDNATEAASITDNAFVTFSFTSASNLLSFASIDAFNVRRNSAGPTTGIFQYQIGTGAFIDIGSAMTWGSVTSAAGNPQSAVSLSGISSLQNVSAGTTVTFRIVNWSASSASGTWFLNDPVGAAGDDFKVSGSTTTPVPEPHEYGVALAGLLGAMIIARRRKASSLTA